ncbi:MAG: hypothetical protein GY906_37135 [bacterium]|nr:hypothetical protein [bacterium]
MAVYAINPNSPEIGKEERGLLIFPLIRDLAEWFILNGIWAGAQDPATGKWFISGVPTMTSTIKHAQIKYNRFPVQSACLQGHMASAPDVTAATDVGSPMLLSKTQNDGRAYGVSIDFLGPGDFNPVANIMLVAANGVRTSIAQTIQGHGGFADALISAELVASQMAAIGDLQNTTPFNVELTAADVTYDNLQGKVGLQYTVDSSLNQTGGGLFSDLILMGARGVTIKGLAAGEWALLRANAGQVRAKAMSTGADLDLIPTAFFYPFTNITIYDADPDLIGSVVLASWDVDPGIYGGDIFEYNNAGHDLSGFVSSTLPTGEFEEIKTAAPNWRSLVTGFGPGLDYFFSRSIFTNPHPGDYIAQAQLVIKRDPNDADEAAIYNEFLSSDRHGSNRAWLRIDNPNGIVDINFWLNSHHTSEIGEAGAYFQLLGWDNALLPQVLEAGWIRASVPEMVVKV